MIDINKLLNPKDKENRKIYKLHVADIDGFNSVAIYKSSKQLMSPTWSPKNDKIAYVSFENNRPEIFIQTLALRRYNQRPFLETHVRRRFRE